MLCTFNQFSEQEHARLAGGKGSMLAKLYQSGYPVPDGFIVLSSSFDDHGLVDAARTDVRSYYHQLIDASSTRIVAVRSSGLAEDSPGASHAGAFETVLNVASETALYEAIQTVFESGKSERIKIYRDAKKQTSVHTMAVVVQQMLTPSYAGVLFTVAPVSGDAKTMQGHLTQGLGDKLVSGELMGEAFTFHTDTGVYDGPEYFKPYQQELFRLATKLVNEVHLPQDIEWAIDHDKLYLLQSRPITNLSHTPEVWNDSLKGDYLWCNTNLGELFGNVITPYTWSIYHEVVRRQVGPLGNHSLVGLIAGRSYFNISLIYSILSKLGKKRKDILGSVDLFLGDIPDHIPIPTIPLSLPVVLRFMLGQIVASLKATLSLKTFLSWAKEECPAWCESQFLAIDQCHDNADLLRVYANIEPTIFKTFAIVAFVGDQFVKHQYKFKSALSGLLEAEEFEVILSGLDGGGQLPSMAPLLGVSAMVKGEITKEEFIRRYGHRGPNEAEFAAPRTAEDPDWIDTLLRQWQDADPEALLLQQKENRDRIWNALEQQQPKQVNKLTQVTYNCDNTRTQP